MSNISEWRSSGAATNYPFSESCSLVSAEQWALVPGLFADAQLRLPASIVGASLLSLTRMGGGLSGIVSYGWQSNGYFSFTADTLNGGVASIIDDFDVTIGFLVAGLDAAQEVKSMPVSFVSFAAGSANFEGSTIFKYPDGVLRSMSIDNLVVTGRVILAEGPGVQLVKEDQTIRVDSIGDRDGVDGCARTPTGIALRTVNAVPPNDLGNFTIEAGSHVTPASQSDLRQVLKIDLSANTLTFSLAR